MKKLIALFGLTFIAGTAFANETMEPTVDDSDLEALFVKLDTDANGSVNADEISALPDLADKFSTADIDQDGGLSKEEFVAIWSEGAAEEEQSAESIQ